jgi:hypothetical protein
MEDEVAAPDLGSRVGGDRAAGSSVEHRGGGGVAVVGTTGIWKMN